MSASKSEKALKPPGTAKSSTPNRMIKTKERKAIQYLQKAAPHYDTKVEDKQLVKDFDVS